MPEQSEMWMEMRMQSDEDLGSQSDEDAEMV